MTRAAVALVALVACGGGAQPDPSGITFFDANRAGALELEVDVFRWACVVTTPTAPKSEAELLRVPIGRPVHLAFRTRDLDHAIAFVGSPKAVWVRRGRPAEITFEIDHPGTYRWTCPTDTATPTSPSNTAEIIAMPPGEYDRYAAAELEKTAPVTLAGKLTLGKTLFVSKQCNSCHTVDGTPRMGASLLGVWGTTVTLTDGSTRVFDAAFARAAILEPETNARAGFPSKMMPSYRDHLSPQELESLVAYLETLTAE